MTDKIKTFLPYFIFTVGCYITSLGFPTEPYKVFCSIWPITMAIVYILFKNNVVKDPDDDLKLELIEKMDSIIQEQDVVLANYEQIFDSQLVKLPCICGGNTFEGLFSPNTDNIVECENCKNKYKVTVDYQSVLVSEPLDLEKHFDELVGKINQ